MVLVRIEPGSSTPPFEQVRLGIAERVRRGELVAGTKLPTVRALAAELGLAVNTVARAYRELEADGVLETRGRHGTFIAESGDPSRDRAGRAAADYVALVRRLGLSDADAVELVRLAQRSG